MQDIHRIAELIERDAWLDLFAAAPQTTRDELGLASATIAGVGLLGCKAIPITELNRAMAIGASQTPSPEEIAAIVDWLDAHATGWSLQVPPDAMPPELAGAAGLRPSGPGWAKFVATAPATDARSDRRGVRVERVGGSDAGAFGAAVAEGFGLPPTCADWFAALVGRRSWHCFAAVVDEEVAGGGTMFIHDAAAWFGIESTRAVYCGRGVQLAVANAMIAAATRLGATVMTAETAQPASRDDAGYSSYRNQERAGLSHVYARPNYGRGA